MFPHSTFFYHVWDSKLGMVHLVQPWGGAGGEVRVSRTAPCGEVWGRASRHGPQSLSHAARPPLRHQAVHVEAQVVEERSVAGQRGDGGGRLGETVRASRSDVVVGLSRRVDGEAAIQRVGHIADAPVKPVGVAEIGQDLVVCGGETVT